MSKRIARRLVRLYPRAWRARYGDELSALLGQTPLTLATIADVVAGAVRERLHATVRFDPQPVSFGREMWRFAVISVCAGGSLTLASRLLANWLRESGTFTAQSDYWFFLLLLPVIRASGLLICRMWANNNGPLAFGPSAGRPPARFAMSAFEFWCWILFTATLAVVVQTELDFPSQMAWSTTWIVWMVWSNTQSEVDRWSRLLQLLRARRT